MSRDGRGRRARWAYRILLMAFPRGVRERFGAEMEDTFLHVLGRADGRGARAGVWLRGGRDALLRGLGMRLRGRDRGAGTSPAPGRRRRRGGDAMGTLMSDVRYAARAMARRPVFTLTAAATLALGIGANTAIFSVVNGLLIRPLPYPDADRLVSLYAENQELGWSETDVNRADAWDWRARSGVLEDVALYQGVALNLTGGDRPELLSALEGTPNLLPLLGASPALGRGFSGADARPGAPLAVILTHGFWERRFGGDASIVGSTLTLDDEVATVVGVLPERFVFPDEMVDLYVPMREDPATAERGGHDTEALAKLRPGIEAAEAERAVDAVAVTLQAEHPEQNAGWTAQVVTLREDILGDVAKQASFVLMAAVAFVLLMACTNVANLLLARAASRRTEIAVRTALGAGRGRILRQLLVESGLLALAGGAGGLALAWWGSRAIVAGLPDNLPPAFEFGLDGTVLAFAAVASLAAALLFGLVPAIRASGPSAADLREGGRGAGGAVGRRFGSFLVVAQTALAVVLLVGAGVMVKSVVGMASRDMGFEPEGVLTLRMSPPVGRYPDAAALDGFWEAVLGEVRAVPGVERVGAIQALPLGGSNWGGTFWVEGVEDPEADPGHAVRHGYVTPGYFAALGIEIVRGRDVTDADRDGAGVALVNESFVRRHAADGEVLGRVLLSSGSAEPVTVVGVIEDHIERGIDRDPEPGLYFPVAGRELRSRTLAIRTSSGDPSELVDAVQAAVWRVDPDQPVYDVATMDERILRRVGGFRLIAQLMGVFGLISLVLGAVGIYGVTSYAVGRRTGEIGIRMAMGADRGRVVGMVIREGLGRVLLGLALGVGLALALSRGIAGLLVGVSPTDPVTFTTVPLVLLIVSLLGSWIPARRASGVDPVRALSAE